MCIGYMQILHHYIWRTWASRILVSMGRLYWLTSLVLQSFSTLVWFCCCCGSTLLPLLEVTSLVYLSVIVYFFHIEQSSWEEWPNISCIIFPRCQISTRHTEGTQIFERINWIFFLKALPNAKQNDYHLMSNLYIFLFNPHNNPTSAGNIVLQSKSKAYVTPTPKVTHTWQTCLQPVPGPMTGITNRSPDSFHRACIHHRALGSVHHLIRFGPWCDIYLPLAH